MNIRMLLLVLVSTASAIVVWGCASASNATSSTFSYIHGDQHATLGASPPQIADATMAAGQDLGLAVDSHSADGLIGNIVMHTTDGTKVQVNIKGEDSDKSDVTIRVGTFGDKALQARVLEKIQSHLTAGGALPAVTPSPAAAPAPVPPSSPSAVPASPPPPAPAAPEPPPPAPAPAEAPPPEPATAPLSPPPPASAPATSSGG